MTTLHSAFLDARHELENLAVHDCTNIPVILAQHLSSPQAVVLIGHWDSDTDGVRRYIQSASFVVQAAAWKSIDQIEAFNVLRDNKSSDKIAELASAYGLEREKSIFVQNRYATCVFPSDFSQDDAVLIADVYEKTLTSSRNFENLIDGVIYSLARPPLRGAFHPKFEDHNKLADVLSERFKIDTRYFYFTGDRKSQGGFKSDDFRDYEDRTLDAWFTPSSDPAFRRKRDIAVGLKQAVVGVTGGETPAHYCLVPASDPSIRDTPVEGVLLLWSDRPISLAAYKAAAIWVREMSARRHVERARSLNEMRATAEQILDEFTATSDGGRAARAAAITRIADQICGHICNLTSASAAGVWLLHNTKEVIHLYGSKATFMGNYRPDYVARDIPTKECATSAIAFSFGYASDRRESSLYIPDVYDLPRAYREKGLVQTLLVRERTRCEVVVRLRRGGLLAGALNVESPVQESLGHDRSFLESCGEILSTFLSRLETSSDRVGLADLADTQIAIHAVKGRLSKWSESDQAGAVAILSQLKRRTAGDDPPPRRRAAQTVKSFNSTWKERVGSHLRQVASTAKARDVFRGEVPTNFPASDLPGLQVIMDSIWKNVEEYTALQDNIIEFQNITQPFANKNILQITWKSPKSLPSSVSTDQIFLHPRLGGTRLHFGFFLVGVHARLMGGHVEFAAEAAAERGFTVRIFIPYA